MTAQELRHLDVLLSHLAVARRRGMDITIPEPEAYVAHKVTVNGVRSIKVGVRSIKVESDAAVVGLCRM